MNIDWFPTTSNKGKQGIVKTVTSNNANECSSELLLHEKCANTEFFLIRKLWTGKNFVSGYSIGYKFDYIAMATFADCLTPSSLGSLQDILREKYIALTLLMAMSQQML